MRAEDKIEKVLAMVAFLKSDLFLRFLGGFVLGTIGVVALHSAEPVAMASTAQSAPVYVDATR